MCIGKKADARYSISSSRETHEIIESTLLRTTLRIFAFVKIFSGESVVIELLVHFLLPSSKDATNASRFFAQ